MALNQAEFQAQCESAAAWLIVNARRQCRCQHPSARPGTERRGRTSQRNVWECSNCGNLAFAR